MAEEQPILEDDQAGPVPRSSLMNILLVVVLILVAGVGGYFAQELITGNSEPIASSPPHADPTGSGGAAGIADGGSDGSSRAFYGELGKDQGESDFKGDGHTGIEQPGRPT